MTKSLMLWSAGLASALGGAIAGNALGSTPVTDRSAVEMLYQTHESASAERQGQRLLPDHYPLVTRSGVVPVARLSDRGVFSQARYRSYDLAADYASGDPGPGFADSATLEPPAPRFAAAEIEPSAAEPLSLAAGPAQIGGSAKVIDVQAMLAIR